MAVLHDKEGGYGVLYTDVVTDDLAAMTVYLAVVRRGQDDVMHVVNVIEKGNAEDFSEELKRRIEAELGPEA